MWKALVIVFLFTSGISSATSGLTPKVHKMLVLAEVYYGSPIFVTSAYRDKERNKEVGGVPNSRHLYGEAIDIRMPQTATLLNKLIWALTVAGFNGVGIYPTHIHADVRRDPTFWKG